MGGMEQAENTFKDAIRLWIGAGVAPDGLPKMTTLEVSEMTGIGLKAVQGHVSTAPGSTNPKLGHLFLYMKILHPSFASRIFGSCGLRIEKAMEHESPTPPAHLRTLADVLSQMAKSLEDGNYNHVEKLADAPILRKVGVDCIILANEFEGLR